MTRVRGYFRSLNTVLLALLGLSAAHVIPLHAAENPGLPRTIA